MNIKIIQVIESCKLSNVEWCHILGLIEGKCSEKFKLVYLILSRQPPSEELLSWSELMLRIARYDSVTSIRERIISISQVSNLYPVDAVHLARAIVSRRMRLLARDEASLIVDRFKTEFLTVKIEI